MITERTNPVIPLAALKQIAADSERESALNAIRHSRLPLWTETHSFQSLRGLTAQGRLPSQREIHVEDFLAAIDFQYADAPAGQLAIRAAAGPSVFGKDYAQLMQVGVQAGSIQDGQPPRHITLAVDISESMRWENRLENVCLALGKFARLLGEEDRLSLVVFNDHAFVMLEDASVEDKDSIAAALDGLSPFGGTNIFAGLRFAADSAMSEAAQQCARRHLVLISDGTPVLAKVSKPGIAALMGDLAGENIDLHIIALQESSASADTAPASLDELAAIANQAAVRCADAGQIEEQLCREIIGSSPVVARASSLTVSFNPAAVRAYRLLGHEATSVGGMLSAELPSQLNAAQAATGLYEVWLEPDGPSLVADVHVTWTDTDGKPQSVRQEIHRRQFKPSWREAALSLQAAAIAAEAAEVLRGSPFAETRDRDLRDVLEQAEEVNPLLARRESFQRFVEVLRRAEAVRRGVWPDE